jgi:hypothetical protein
MINFKRYAIQVKKINDPFKERISYHSLGSQLSYYISEAHLYTKFDLAQSKADYYIKNSQWYYDVEIIEINCEFK